MSWVKIIRISAVITTNAQSITIRPSGQSATLHLAIGDDHGVEVDAADLLEAVEAMARESGLQGLEETA